MRRRASKYGNKQVLYEGIKFHSKKEAKRYQELKLLEKAGEVSNVRCQEAFILEAYGEKICTYRADFCYTDVLNQKGVIEDVKGVRTAVFNIKWKLLKAQYKDQYIYRIT